MIVMIGVYLLLGAISGIMSGLFGIGGAVIIIPALSAIFFYYTSVPDQYIMHMAVGTSMATVIFTSLSSMYAHHKHGAVFWKKAIEMLPGLAVGAIIGAFIAHLLPSTALRIFFGLFLIFIGIRLLISRDQTVEGQGVSPLFTHIASFFIGVLSSILGVGGGTLIVPFLLKSHLDMRQATGTSVLCGISVSLMATITFMITGLFAVKHLPYSTGYVYWPAFIGIVVASILFAPLGAELAHKLPKQILQRIFGIFLLIMAIDMLIFGK